jgi:hypothetical protein
MSRNENRAGVVSDGSDMTMGVTNQDNNSPTADLGWAQPTEFVALPSQGRFYGPGHPLEGSETVEIRFMTARDEDILSSRTYIQEGVVLDKLIENILVDKRIKASNLLVGDKNAIVVHARISGYGPEYETEVTCTACNTTQKNVFDLEDYKTIDSTDVLANSDAVTTDSGTFLIHLPLMNIDIEVKLLTGKDQSKFLKESQRKRKKNLDASGITDQLRTFIVSIDGETDPFSMQKFIFDMPARDARHLRNVYAGLMPNIDLTQEFSCDNCGHTTDLEVPLGANFFWPDL